MCARINTSRSSVHTLTLLYRKKHRQDAERARFELAVELPPQWFSRPSRSTTPTPLLMVYSLQSGLGKLIMTGVCLFCQTGFKKREKKYKFCSLRCSNRFNRNGLNIITLPSHEKTLAEFIGICLGDGNVSQYQTGITLNANADREYIPYIQQLISSLFSGATLSLVKKLKDNAVEIKINSRIVADFMRSQGIVSHNKFIPQWIYEKPSFKQACVRGLFDTEGSISFKQYLSKKSGLSFYKQLNFRNCDEQLMQLVRDTLVDLGLKPTMTLKKSLYLSNDKSIGIFRDQIGFNNPKLLKRSLVMTETDYFRLLEDKLITPTIDFL